MRCERCRGDGKVIERHNLSETTLPGNGLQVSQHISRMVPCPDCNGSGQAHCCDGLCAQPDRD